MRQFILFMLFSFGLLFAKDDYYRNRILFCLNNNISHLQFDQRKKPYVNVDNQSVNALLQKYKIIKIEKWLTSADDSDVVDGVNLSKIYRIEFESKYDLPELKNIIADFGNAPDIHSADYEPIHRIKQATGPYTPDDPRFNLQWYIEKIQADYAWDLWQDKTPGDSIILIGIVDTGIDYLHPDLKESLFINPGEDIDGDGRITAVDSNGVDDDGNGKKDDFMGWDFAGKNSDAPHDNDVRPPHAGEGAVLSHGTHCAGIAAATADNGIGIAGVSFRSKIIATKHSYDDDLEYPVYLNGTGYDGILYCAKMGADVINCSWGGRGYSLYFDKYLLKEVTEKYNAVVVCAAGNDNDEDSDPDDHNGNHYPSSYERTLSVAATTSSDNKASFSNYGKLIDIAAPGVNIHSTIHDNAGSYASWPGTSMASPVVAGSYALLKAWFPDSGNTWLTEKLLSTADNIDDVNASYAGKLGSGRVNVYNAIASSIFPRISINDYAYVITNDNGDGQLSPGDSVRVLITLSNDKLWMPAGNIEMIVSSESESIVFTDSLARISELENGEMDYNQDDEILLYIREDALYGTFTINVHISANQDSGMPYTFSDTIELTLSLNQAGFPVIGNSVSAPLAVTDLKGDEKLEVVSIDETNYCNVYHHDGKSAGGFPILSGGYATAPPVIADMDNDGKKEIVLISQSGVVTVAKSSGSIRTKIELGETIYGNLSVADMDLDGELEMVVGSMKKNLHVIKLDSTGLPGFPMEFSSGIRQGVALADLDADEIPEMIFSTQDKKLFVLNAFGDTLYNYPVTLDTRLSQTPVIYNREDNFNIIFPTVDNRLMIYNLDTVKVVDYQLENAITSALALEDLDNDGLPEVCFATEGGLLYAMHLDGTVMNNFPVTIEGSVLTAPVFADFGDDGTVEAVTSTQTGKVYVINADGSFYTGFPASFEGHLNGSPVIADLDRDGDPEIVAGGYSGINVIDMAGDFGQSKLWNTYLGNNRRTGYYTDAVTGVKNIASAGVPDRFALDQNYPNPFNPVTTISYRLPAYSNVRLIVYDLLGRKIKTLFSGYKPAGVYQLQWNGLNDQGRQVGSGLYIYTLCAELKDGRSHVINRKMLMLK